MIQLDQTALSYTAEETARSVKNASGITISDAQARRIAERAVRSYISESTKVQGMKMKPSTRQIASLEVGQTCEVEATCKQNLHGQFKTIRRVLKEPERKWRVGHLGANIWRVYRMPDGADLKKKPADLNKKAIVLSKIGYDPVLLREYPRPAYFLDDNTKSKARELLGEPDANWTAASRPEGILVWRKTERSAIAKRRLKKPFPVWNDAKLAQLDELLDKHVPVRLIAPKMKTSRGAIYTQIKKRSQRCQD